MGFGETAGVGLIGAKEMIGRYRPCPVSAWSVLGVLLAKMSYRNSVV